MTLALSLKLLATSKEILLCLFSSALLILSFPTPNIEFFAWFGFVPLFFALRNKSKAKAFLLSYFTGIIFWAGIIYWLVHVTLPGTIVLILYLALYFGIFGLVFAMSYELRAMSCIFIPVFWVLLEYIRGHLFTGFPWALLGYSQYLNLPVIQIADIFGVWGVSFLIMLVNVGIYYFVAGNKKYLILTLFCIIATLGYGYYRVHELRAMSYELRVKISVIQGNIPQELKWNPETNEYIIQKYLELSVQAAKGAPDLIIWPEAALPVVLEEEPAFFERVRSFVRETKIPLLLGAVTTRGGAYYNSAILLSSDGDILGRYDKLHLVPFGEYIPLKDALPFLETIVPIGDVKPGEEYTVFKLTADKIRTQEKFSVLICFEDLFPALARDFKKKGAGFLVNITNDAWYKDSSAPFQHLQASVFRAVENRLYLVRAANTGVSCFIGPNGRVISFVEDKNSKKIFVTGFRTENLAIPINR